MADERAANLAAPWCQALLKSPLWEEITLEAEDPTLPRIDTNSYWSSIISCDRGIHVTYLLIKSEANTDASEPDVMSVMSLGSGLAGNGKTLHGGATASMLDMVTGLAVQAVEKAMLITTASLKIDYKTPCYVPTAVLAKAWIYRKEGRKLFIRGTIEDGSGKIFASADAIYVKLKQKL